MKEMDAAWTPPRGAECYRETDQLPVLDRTSFPYGSSGYCRRGSNDDGFSCRNFLYRDETGYVICDVKGKGQISRIWLLGNAPEGDTSPDRVRIEIDGEIAADLPYERFIEAETPPFLPPYSVFDPCGCVRVCCLPMPFERSAKVICSKAKGFWQVDYQLFGEGNVRSFRPAETQEGGVLSRITQNPNQAPGVTAKKTVSLAKGKSDQFAFDRPGVINGIRIRIGNQDISRFPDSHEASNCRGLLNGLMLRCFWDGELTPSVAAPFGLFFGMGSLGYNSKSQSLMFGTDDTQVLYNYFPMPFFHSAVLEIGNRTETDVVLEVEIRLSENRFRYADAGYFRTKYSNCYLPRKDPFEAILLSVSGSGKVVAVQENLCGNEGDAWFEEGDNRFYIDGMKTPSVIGTGTEDFYNGAGYFIDSHGVPKLGLNSHPLSGYTSYLRANHDGRLWEATSMYRVLIHDALNFRDGITLAFEHGGGEFSETPNWNSLQNVGCEALVSYYHKETASIVRVDGVTAGDMASSAQAQLRTERSAFFGRGNLFPEEKTFAYLSGPVTFRLDLSRCGSGALLRRTFACGAFGEADVYVDGEWAGIWHNCEKNEHFRFAEDRFYLGARFTKGKNRAEIRIVPVSGEWNFSELALYAFEESVPDQPVLDGKVFTLGQAGDFRAVENHSGNICLIDNNTGDVLTDCGGIQACGHPEAGLDDTAVWVVRGSGGQVSFQNAGTGHFLGVDRQTLFASRTEQWIPLTEKTERDKMLFPWPFAGGT